ncbi:MAG TPA: HPF/RaiA family ribosome-associated protein [Treponemataceae bacterium]|nr:HPF/RaiA family ribosome-associated protein [Treponemataceae bacterium]HPS43570.1 HPF/RaiA family ribosome-associated protein [Treponemataceae bacterium]
MNINVETVRFTLDEDRKAFVDKKLERIKYAEELITDVIVNIKLDRQFYADATVNFRWGGNAHVTAEDFDFNATVNKLMDVLDGKIRKEKDKIQDRK